MKCDGDDPKTFCDDCEPCTVDVNCTPCSTIPEPHTIYNCTLDEKLPPWCAGLVGCAHYALTDPVGSKDHCFPSNGPGDPHTGFCCDGACVDNGTTCGGAMPATAPVVR